MRKKTKMEIFLAIISLMFLFAIKTNNGNKVNEKRNGFDADDEFDY